MRTPLILLSLLILSLLPGYGMRERTMSSQTGNDTVVFFDRYGTTEPRKINGEIHGNITSLRDPNAPTDSIRMDNYQWAISMKHLTYPEYRRMIYPLWALIDAAYEPGYDTIYIRPTDSKLKVHKRKMTTTYLEEDLDKLRTKRKIQAEGSHSGKLGSYKIGEATVFDLHFLLHYIVLKEKEEFRCAQLEISIENYDTTVVDIDIENQKLHLNGRLYDPADRKHFIESAITLQGLIRIARQTEEGPDTVSYRYDYNIVEGNYKGSIVRCDAD